MNKDSVSVSVSVSLSMSMSMSMSVISDLEGTPSEEHLLPLSSTRGGPRWRVALVVSLLGFNKGSGRQIDLGWFGLLKIN